MFSNINNSFRNLFDTWHQQRLVSAVVLAEGVQERFQNMKETLERIQKSLNQYLEKKRQSFPRFYFLSNEDLLEILGNSRDPQKV